MSRAFDALVLAGASRQLGLLLRPRLAVGCHQALVRGVSGRSWLVLVPRPQPMLLLMPPGPVPVLPVLPVLMLQPALVLLLLPVLALAPALVPGLALAQRRFLMRAP